MKNWKLEKRILSRKREEIGCKATVRICDAV